ncbi:MAG: hypothetical protein KC421_21165 [Anaerolineales bacterium]|nr:hypothetical protein [Anaerolineales bacterium]
MRKLIDFCCDFILNRRLNVAGRGPVWRLAIVQAAVVILCFLLIGSGSTELAAAQQADQSLWLDISLGSPLVEWFNEVARPDDIARVENVGQIGLLSEVTAGRKLVVFKSVAEAESVIPTIADRLDIIGYNLERGNLNADADKADPVGSAVRMRELADEYGLLLAFGPDHDFALSDGVAIAPYVDIFVLQIQRVQTEPQTVFDFVRPLVPQLRAANPDLQVSVQIRTEGNVAEIGNLVVALQDDLDGVSVLTSPETVAIARDMVAELQSRTAVSNETDSSDSLPSGRPPALTIPPPSLPDNGRAGMPIGVLFLGVLGVVVGAFIVFARFRQ